jgi:hypothetical protein
MEDRQHIHNIINHQAQGKCSRDDMMNWVTQIVEKYEIKRIAIFNYYVDVFRSKFYPQPIIHITGAELSDSCPTCGETPDECGRIFRIGKQNYDLDYDIVSVTCLNCGCVYSTKGDNHRKYALAIEER